MINCQKYNSGQALMTAVVFLLFISLAIIGGMVFSSLDGSSLARDLIDSKKSYFLAEASVEDVVYRVISGMTYSSEEVLSLDGSFATTTAVDVAGDVEINSVADADDNIRKIKIVMTNDDGISFHYGVQVGDGGLIMEGNSYVTGNIYSNGPVEGYNNNVMNGDVVSAGAAGSVDGADTTGSVYAHSISDSEIDGDAYYQIISGTIVHGDKYPGSSDQPEADLPISDEKIEEWEQAAASGGVINSPCPYVITSTAALGPVKINCDLRIKGNASVVLSGPVWVSGNINIENNAVIKINSSVGNKSLAIIADNPDNRTTSSKVILENNAIFNGSGEEGSYVLVISRNNSAESGGAERAIEIGNNANGDLLLYAGHGEILLENDVNLREATAYRIHLQNNATIFYETGMASLLFESGPSGGMSVTSWEEVE